jgi:hypothetical protein
MVTRSAVSIFRLYVFMVEVFYVGWDGHPSDKTPVNSDHYRIANTTVEAHVELCKNS